MSGAGGKVDGYNSFNSDAKEAQVRLVFFRVVQEPPAGADADEAFRLLLPEEDAASGLSQIQQVQVVGGSTSGTFSQTVPQVNPDRKFYTPCFILEEEKTYYRDNDEKLLSTHRLKLESSGEDTIYVAKHGRKKNYCSVCKADYQDYLEHVKEDPHKQQLRSNKFSKYILETEQDFRKRKEDPKDIINLDSKLLDQTNELDKNSRLLNRPAL